MLFADGNLIIFQVANITLYNYMWMNKSPSMSTDSDSFVVYCSAIQNYHFNIYLKTQFKKRITIESCAKCHRVSALNCTAKLKSPAVWACLVVYPLDMPRAPYRASEGKRSQ